MAAQRQQLSHHFNVPILACALEAILCVTLTSSMHVHLTIVRQCQQLTHHIEVSKLTGHAEASLKTPLSSGMHVHLAMASQRQ